MTQSTISRYLYDRQGAAALSRLFDKASVVILVAGYVVVNLALPLAAIYRE